MKSILFENPRHIDEIREKYDITKISIITTPNIYPMVKGIEFYSDKVVFLEKRKAFPIKRKMDAHIESYQNAMLREWNRTKRILAGIKNQIKDIKKMDYNNLQTIDRIAKIPFKDKKNFVELANKHNLNLSILDAIVSNPSILVNARYDSRKNIIELNPEYMKQHGTIRIGEVEISEINKTFIHEFAHAYWHCSLTEEERRSWQMLSKFLRREELTGDMNQYVVGEKTRADGSVVYSPVYTHRDDAFISIYSRFNPKEDWAECFLYYKVSPKSLQEVDSKKFDFINEKLDSTLTKKDSISKLSEKSILNPFKPAIKNPQEIRSQIISRLDRLKDSLSYKAKEHLTSAYGLGRQKGSYATDRVYDAKLKQKDKEKIQQLIQENDAYLDNFMDNLVDEYQDILFVLTPTGMVESVRDYADPNEFDNAFNDVMETKEHRLGLYAVAGLSNALIAGMIDETKEDFGGGYWRATGDDRECDGCRRLDGKWLSNDEFQEIFGNNDCDGNCRCGELFEPAPAPEGGVYGIKEVKTEEHRAEDRAMEEVFSSLFSEKMTKVNVDGQQKRVAVDYHGTLMIDNKVNGDLRAKLQEMKANGYHIIVYTSGITENPSILHGINVWLKENQVPYDEVWQRQGKPDVDLYIDDKSVNPNKEDVREIKV